MLDRVDVKKNEVAWVCSCDKEHISQLDELEIGHDNPDAISMPLCGCGRRIIYFRTWDAVVDAPHRRAINSLAEYLIEIGNSTASAKAIHDAEETYPALLADLSKPVDDLTGRKAVAEAKAVAVAAAEAWEAARPEREAAEAAARAQAEVDEDEHLFQVAEARRRALASAAVNKRLGLTPGAEPPAEDLAAELEKSADEIIEDMRAA